MFFSSGNTPINVSVSRDFQKSKQNKNIKQNFPIFWVDWTFLNEERLSYLVFVQRIS